MPVNVFVLGLPGSGKSTACRITSDVLQKKGVSQTQIKHIDAFDILNLMAAEDHQKNPPALRRFELTPYGGFNIKPPFAPFDEALQQINARLHQHHAYEWALVEFARNDYMDAFQHFSPAFLQTAFFLFLKAPRKICHNRLHQRILERQTPDDYYVSDHIFNTYYKRPARLHPAHFCQRYHLAPEQVHVLPNNAKLKKFTLDVEAFVLRVLRFQEQRALLTRSVP